jgi:hypothetical protein
MATPPQDSALHEGNIANGAASTAAPNNGADVEADLPSLFLKLLCQNPKCRAPIGGMHIPAPEARLIIYCHKCGARSGFLQTSHGVRTGFDFKAWKR